MGASLHRSKSSYMYLGEGRMSCVQSSPPCSQTEASHSLQWVQGQHSTGEPSAPSGWPLSLPPTSIYGWFVIVVICLYVGIGRQSYSFNYTVCTIPQWHQVCRTLCHHRSQAIHLQCYCIGWVKSIIILQVFGFIPRPVPMLFNVANFSGCMLLYYHRSGNFCC